MKKIINVIFSVIFSVLIISTIIKFTVGFKQLYYFDIEYLNIPVLSGLSKEDIKKNYDYMIDYNLDKDNKEFELPSIKSSENGKIHFEEVRNIFQILNKIFKISLVLSIIGLVINILNKKMQDEISKLNFEKAKDINNDIVLLKSLSHKQDIINNANENKPILAWINLDDENIKIYVIKGAKLLKSELIKVEDFELDNLIYTIKEQILRNEENIAEEVVDKYYIDFANILYSYIKSNKDINYKYI